MMTAASPLSRFLGARIIADPNPKRYSRSVSLPPRPPLRISAHVPAAERPPPSARAAESSLYDVLGLSFGATCADVKKAYRRLARTCHPDVLGGGESAESAEEFMRVHAAYSTLSDPEKRAEYDRMTMIERRVGPVFSSRRSSRRTWETDQCW